MGQETSRNADEEEKVSGSIDTHSDTFVDHADNPRNAGSISDADAYASVLGACGDNMEMWLKVRNGRVVNATFWTDGCGSTIACGSVATELARGKTIGEALSVSAEVIVKALGGLPKESIHCAGLVASTLKKALIEYLYLQKEPWKKAYRRR
ncbi:MAG: iron-sulfur cluster assembly scaffold protein [Chloroflexota bacterium]